MNGLNVTMIPTPIAAGPTMARPIVMTFRTAVPIDPVEAALPARPVAGHSIDGPEDRLPQPAPGTAEPGRVFALLFHTVPSCPSGAGTTARCS